MNNKIFGNHKLNILIITVAMLLFVMPTIATIVLMNRMNEDNKKIESINDSLNADGTSESETMLQNGTDQAYDSDSITGIDSFSSPEYIVSNESITAEQGLPEMDTTAPNPLLMASGASITDADDVADTEENESANSEDELASVDADDVATDNDASNKSSSKTASKKLNGKKVYLTFDDGPTDHSNELMDILDKYNVKATFFVVVNSPKHAAELNRMVRDGHTLGLHSESHVYSKVYADLNSFKKDVSGVHDWVKRLTGYDAKYYRFPGGSSNTVSNVSMSDCIDYLHKNGYEYFDWNALSFDAENTYLGTDQLNSNVLSYVRNNPEDSVVLLHDLQDQHNTIDALPDLIETLQSEGYELCALDENAPLVQHYVPDDENEEESEEKYEEEYDGEYEEEYDGEYKEIIEE